jgi:hypothetical protein
MSDRKRYLIAFNLISSAAVLMWCIILYSVHLLDWFLILFPMVPAVLLVIAVGYMPKGDD